MIGMPATGLAGPAPAGPAPTPDPADPRSLPPAMKTMVGVAIPGIAPIQRDEPSPSPAAEPPGGGARPLDLRSKQSTMLGVAVPAIVPPHARGPAAGAPASPPPPIVPAPAPLAFEPLPEAPVVPTKRGVPAVAVVGLVFLLVAAAGGVAAFVASRSAGKLQAQPELDEQGREILRIACSSCADGATVTLGASTATFTKQTALLPLPAPLTVGENKLVVRLDRPGAGRDEDITMHVPVAYRVRADLTTLTATPPVITVRVDAAPDSTVTVDQKPLTLDASGKGTYAVDVSSEVLGPRDEAVALERKIPFTVTPKGGNAESGQLVAKTSVVPLHLDAPGLTLFTDKATVAIAGQTPPNTTVTIDGQSAPVDAQGRFGVRTALAAAPAEKTFEIVASAPPLAPRIVRAKVVRTASLEGAARTLDAEARMTFDAFAASAATEIGKAAMIEGEVVEARASGGYTVLLVDEKHACTRASCLVRVVHGDEVRLARGAHVRAYGRVAGVVSQAGSTIPDLDASLLLPLKPVK